MNKFISIGEYIGTIEEFIPQKGTYAEEGKIYASNIGELILDHEKRTARVDGKMPVELEVGQTVFGDVLSIRKNNVVVIIRKIQGSDNELDIKSAIYVSNITNSYVEKPEDCFGVGDIIKAKVIKIERGMIDLSTKDNDGVVKAFCKRCRNPLVKSDKHKDKLKCLNCGHVEDRKIADDYAGVYNL